MAEKSPATTRGAKRYFTPFSVTFVLRCLPFRETRGQRKGRWNDSMVPEKRRGCPLESGRKGGRNKSSASNRGRASARFYSRTLNSIAIGFSGCLRTLHRVLFRFLATPPLSPHRRARRPLCLFLYRSSATYIAEHLGGFLHVETLLQATR